MRGPDAVAAARPLETPARPARVRVVTKMGQDPAHRMSKVLVLVVVVVEWCAVLILCGCCCRLLSTTWPFRMSTRETAVKVQHAPSEWLPTQTRRHGG